MTTTPPSAHDTEPPAEEKARALTQHGIAAATPGVVTGRPLTWLRVEGLAHNLAHTAPLPLALLGAGTQWHTTALTVAGAVGLLHLGLDRVLKYGVKYDHNPGVTHLGAHGEH